MIRRITFAVLAAGVLLTTPAGAAPQPVRVAIVLKGLDNPFFVALYEGAKAEVARRGVVASFRAATDIDDAAGQAAHARALVRTDHDCYVVNPLTVTNLVRPFQGVKQPIVNVDSPVDAAAARRAGLRIVTYIGTDDAAAGALAAKGMASALGGRGEVALVGGSGVNSALRLRGFARGLAAVQVRIVARASAGYDRARAQLAARRILREYPRVAGFFAANDEMALGIADAVQAAGRRGAVRVIGVDAIPAALDAVRAGGLTATIAQYPYVMGSMAVEACIAAARGATLPRRVNAPIVLVTKDNVARALAAFPKPMGPYADPFARLLRGRH